MSSWEYSFGSGLLSGYAAKHLVKFSSEMVALLTVYRRVKFPCNNCNLQKHTYDNLRYHEVALTTANENRIE